MYRLIMRFIISASIAMALVACGQTSTAPSEPAADIPASLSASGDAAQGKIFFEGIGGCSACH